MKKILVSLAAVAVIGTGGAFAYTQTNDIQEPKKEEATQPGATPGNEEKEPVSNSIKENTKDYNAKNPPVSRTVSVGENKPWQMFSSDYIKDLQNNGEIVYLFSDAEELENEVTKSFTTEQTLAEGTTMQDVANSWAADVGSFIQVTEKYYPEKQAYFDKMKEVQSNLESGNYESVPTMIEEAKTLR